MPDRRVTIEDVARLARVSAATVSRALKDSPLISRQTRRRVSRAARRLGYVPNQAARSLVTRTTHTLGLMIPDVTDPIHGQIVTGFQQEAAARGYTVIMANGLADPAVERRALRVFLAQRADGVALMGSVLRQRPVRALLRPAPVVFISGEHPTLAGYRGDLAAGCIRANDIEGIHDVVRHLLEAGYRRIAYFNGPPRASNATRRETVIRALRAAGVRPPVEFGPVGPASPPDGVAARIARHPPEALICYDDKLALNIIDALRALGVRVPGDLAVVGFDDIPFAAMANPRLTTVSQRSTEMGRVAARMLCRALETGDLPPSVTLPVRLIVRESTIRPARGEQGTARPAS